MAIPENPSAGKFEPPAVPDPTPPRRRRLWTVALTAAIGLTAVAELFSLGRGRVALFSAIAVLGLTILESLILRTLHGDSAAPYSRRTSITR